MSTATLYDHGLDYVTATTTSRKLFLDTVDLYQAVKVTLEARGHREEPFGFQGYKGLKTGGIFIGEREQDFITQATGDDAKDWGTFLLGTGWRPSRLDVQVTGLFDRDREDLARQLVVGTLAQRESPENGTPWKVHLDQGYGAGDTLYVGSKKSDRFGRLYDKHRESKGEYPIGSWRWEMQTRKHFAVLAFALIEEAEDPQAAIRGLVLDYFAAKGIPVPVDANFAPAELHLGRAKTTDEQSLEWLAKYVRPTVRRLIQNDKRAAMLRALGLDDLT